MGIFLHRVQNDHLSQAASVYTPLPYSTVAKAWSDDSLRQDKTPTVVLQNCLPCAAPTIPLSHSTRGIYTRLRQYGQQSSETRTYSFLGHDINVSIVTFCHWELH